jgi:ABC-2 type transport system ATP-binding protein
LLAQAAGRLAGTYSGGMLRRLDLAAGLVASPPVLFLDEPTTGLDPRSRMDMWGAIEQLTTGGTTVLLTTQYLEEADRLAHRIVVFDCGHVVAEGTPSELKGRTGGEIVELHVTGRPGFDAALTAVSSLAEGAPATDRDRGRITLPAPGGAATLKAVLDCLERSQIPVADIGLRQPSLDEVFLTLTGHGAGHDDRPQPASGHRARSPR